ncbi:MAG TPA: ABC transporter ATP-binding protein [Candidatus Binataceae bacterium]|nr:ABC transporter ATP-binding protein [Candidatus Binataceae bacterium]
MNRADGTGIEALRATGITAGYGARTVLHGLSFEVKAGEMLAVVGPNGAGKSTMLRVVNGALRSRQGAVDLLGRRLEDYGRRELARIIATVAQENQVAFHFTVLEIVLMGRAPHLGSLHFESRRDLEIAHAALERFGLLELAHRAIHEVSGGERKRVFLARALAQEPKVALLDEPTAFLDLRHIAEIFTQFRELCSERAMAVVATMHDLNTAALYADRVLLLKDGATVACGTPDEVLTSANLTDVYEVEVEVSRNPATGGLTVLVGAPASPR